MIDFTLNNNEYSIPGTWEELSSKQFTDIVPELLKLLKGEIGVQECRVLTALILTGLMPRRFRSLEHEQYFNENIYRISQAITFMLRIEYDKSTAFSKLKKEAREALYRYLPEELSEEMTEVRWAKKQKYSAIPDLVFAKNLVPVISGRMNKLKGYIFELKGTLLESSLTFIQLIDAQHLSNQLFNNPTPELYNRFIATLYYPGTYNPDKVGNIAVPKLNDGIKQAILFNFNAIQAFLYTRTKYNVLFNDNGKEKSNSLGLVGVGYSLTKSGYGDMDNKPMLKVFDIMYAELVSTIKELKAAGLSIDKISEQTNLTLRVINQLV